MQMKWMILMLLGMGRLARRVDGIQWDEGCSATRRIQPSQRGDAYRLKP